MKTEKRYLVPGDYMADPAVHVFDGKLYIYPSHDWESGIAENDNGDHFNMKDYHVYSMDDVMNGEIKDHGVVLRIFLGRAVNYGIVMWFVKMVSTICIFH